MTNENVFYRIVVPTDFSDCSEQAWALAQRLARAFAAELVLVHILAEPPPHEEGPFSLAQAEKVYEGSRKWVEDSLQAWAAKAQSQGLNVRVVLRPGAPDRELVTLAMDERADLVVIGTHGRGGIDRALLGSVADRVVRTAPCPVLTVRKPE
jgi:nucleotide-binding universal stress UspA family protein